MDTLKLELSRFGYAHKFDTVIDLFSESLEQNVEEIDGAKGDLYYLLARHTNPSWEYILDAVRVICWSRQPILQGYVSSPRHETQLAF